MSKRIDPFEFMLPTTVKFGDNIIEEIPASLEAYGAKKPIVVTDPALEKLGAAKRVTDVLEKAGITGTKIYSNVKPNPRDVDVEALAKLAQDDGIDSFIALGGGSPMDTAKGASLLVSNGGCIKDWEGYVEPKNPTPPLFVIPTTVGTGSEVTFWAVIKDTKENYKLSVGTPAIGPNIAFVDPTFVDTLPGSIVAATGMDALTHAIEGYTANLSEPITDACGLHAIKLISQNIRAATYSDDHDAKANMLIGSLIAGICFGNSDVTACHCMSEALGGLYDMPHGVANAIMLPYTMEYNYVSDVQKFADVAEAMGVNIRNMSTAEAAVAAVNEVKQLNVDLNIPKLKDVGGKAEDLDELAMRSAGNPAVPSNPRPVTEADFKVMIAKALEE